MGPQGKALLPMYHEIDRTVAKEARRTTCKKGCNHCCAQMIVTTGPEALAVAEEVVERFTGAEIAEVIKELDRQVQIVREIETACGKDYIEGVFEVREEFWQRRVPCALLASGGTCRVYNVRPIPCRTYVVSNDPELCGRRTMQNVSQIVFGDPGETLDIRAMNLLLEAAEEDGRRPVLGLFQSLVLRFIRAILHARSTSILRA